MHTRTALLVAVVVLFGTGPAVGLASAADVTLTVSVRTAAGGPVNNADLTASWDGGSTTARTASNGKAFVDVPEGADVTIEVDHQFYVRNAPYEVPDVSEEEVTVTVWEKAFATVSVVDSDGPLEDARVVFRKDGTVVGIHRTDAQGIVESGVIESGEYTLAFFKSGYLRQATAVTIRGDATEEARLERGSVTLTLRVFDDKFDPPRPIPDATISSVAIGSVPTQPDGHRSVSVPVNSELAITVEKEGYLSTERTVVVRERDTAVNITTRRTPAVQLESANQRVVVGESVQVTVTDEYGDPVPDATVYLGGAPVGQPDDAGVLMVPIESTGEHVVDARVGQLSSDPVTIAGVGEDGSIDGDDEGTTTDDGGVDDDGLLGDLSPRSTAIGLAGGLVLAAVLFLAVRSR